MTALTPRALLAFALVGLVACDPPPAAAPECPAEPLVAYGGFQADGVLEIVVLAPFNASTARVFDTVQPDEVIGGALLHQSGDNYLRVSILPDDDATKAIVRTVHLCAPKGTDATDGRLYPHLSLVVELPASREEGVPVKVSISIEAEA
jgi:hypothetical protein